MARIFYINKTRMPTEKAHGYQIAKMCEAFADLGYKVHLLVPTRDNTVKDNAFDFYNVRKNFEINFLSIIDLITYWSTWRILAKPTHLLTHWMFLREVKSFLKKQSFSNNDFIYTRDPIIARVFNHHKNLILEVHKDSKVFKYYKPKCRVITITEKLKEILVGRGVPVENIKVVPDAVDLADFDPPAGGLLNKEEARRQLGLPPDKKLVGYVGKFSTQGLSKGLETLLASLVGIDAVSVLVGGLEKEIEKYKVRANELRVDDKVIFVPLQPRAKVPLYLVAMDVLVMPSPKLPFYQYYTSPLKLFEYMAAGHPIVASDLPALREILNESNSVLVEPDNPQKLAEGINKILVDKSFADKISNQAKQDVQRYTWKKRAEKCLVK